jgi:hypothetical protein
VTAYGYKNLMSDRVSDVLVQEATKQVLVSSLDGSFILMSYQVLPVTNLCFIAIENAGGKPRRASRRSVPPPCCVPGMTGDSEVML